MHIRKIHAAKLKEYTRAGNRTEQSVMGQLMYSQFQEHKKSMKQGSL